VDSFIVKNKFNKKEKEIRLYGLDAPESKRNRKLIEDYKKINLECGFMIKFGKKAIELF